VIVEKEATNAVLSAGNLYAKGFILTAAREDEKLFVDLILWPRLRLTSRTGFSSLMNF
jgi:hypothetical protein